MAIKKTAAGRGAASEAGGETMTTGVHLPRDIWVLLREVAFKRALTFGGRASVSAVLVDLVRQHEKELRKEIER